LVSESNRSHGSWNLSNLTIIVADERHLLLLELRK
jgi:hypothetical protein